MVKIGDGGFLGLWVFGDLLIGLLWWVTDQFAIFGCWVFLDGFWSQLWGWVVVTVVGLWVGWI